MPASDQGVAASAGRYQLIPRVLCLVRSGDEVLLLQGAANKKIWPGLYNGLGGHVERGESAAEAARREIAEEASLEVDDLRLRGVITIDTGESPGIGLFVFTAQARSRHFTASAEGALAWVPLAQVPALNVVPDLPALLAYLEQQPAGAPPFCARSWYDAAGTLQTAYEPAAEAA